MLLPGAKSEGEAEMIGVQIPRRQHYTYAYKTPDSMDREGKATGRMPAPTRRAEYFESSAAESERALKQALWNQERERERTRSLPSP